MQSLNEKIRTRLRLTYVVTDLLTTNTGMMLFNIFRWSMQSYDVSFADFYRYPRVLWGQLIFPLIMLGIYWLSGYYNRVEKRSRAQEAVTTAGSVALGTLAIFFLAVVNDSQWSRTRVFEYMLASFAMLFICVYAGRYAVTRFSRRSHRAAGSIRPAIMLGTDLDALTLVERINSSRQPDRFSISTLVRTSPLADEAGPACAGFEIIDLSQLKDYCRIHPVSAIILTPTMMSAGKELARIIRLAAEIDTPVFVAPDLNTLALSSKRSFNIMDEPLVCITSPNISDSTINMKRAADIFGSALAMILLSPLMAFLAYKVKRDSPGPVFYRQERLGYGGKPFKIIKFRSMIDNAEANGRIQVTVDHDPRVTRFGRTLRKYRLDELPQFWNVLRGEMSLVGPRPERRHFADHIAARVPQYPFIYQVRPGITSWGMVRYGYASTVDQMVERLRYDLIYIENISILTDLKILLHTVRTVVGGHGK